MIMQISKTVIILRHFPCFLYCFRSSESCIGRLGIFKQIQQAVGSDDAAQAKWFALDALPGLAFDHELIIQKALSNNEIKEELNK